jgi:phosphoribosyl-ATP pyrophosphohydrolase/phosphoribosyl-AMP cyclohydrolase
VQRVKQILLDCDGDTLLVLVEPAGPACHTGTTSCFQQPLDQSESEVKDG